MNKTRAVTLLLFSSLIAVGLTHSFSRAASSKPSAATAKAAVISLVVAPQDCSKCEGKCKSWIDKCKDGGQYACYKAAACLCKCNLDAGGCGSSKEALQECYEKNEKLAKELEPPAIEK